MTAPDPRPTETAPDPLCGECGLVASKHRNVIGHPSNARLSEGCLCGEVTVLRAHIARLAAPVERTHREGCVFRGVVSGFESCRCGFPVERTEGEREDLLRDISALDLALENAFGLLDFTSEEKSGLRKAATRIRSVLARRAVAPDWKFRNELRTMLVRVLHAANAPQGHAHLTALAKLVGVWESDGANYEQIADGVLGHFRPPVVPEGAVSANWMRAANELVLALDLHIGGEGDRILAKHGIQDAARPRETGGTET